jgi:uncharacterized membrane protein YgdD (TMEM256/DUF423 family)
MFVDVILELLFFMVCFFILGEPWRLVVRRFVDVFKNLDTLQVLVLDVYLGGFLLYVIAMIPLHLFSADVLYAITLASAAFVLWFHRKGVEGAAQNLRLHIRRFSFRNHLSSDPLLLIVLIFLFGLVVETLALNGLIFGSIRDTSLHALFAQVLLENKQVSMTLQPYSSEGIIYPQGFTPMVAYSVLVSNYSPPEAVFYLTAFFNAFTILGVYFLGKTLSLAKKEYVGLSLAFVFAFFACWPKYLTWGSNALVASFPLFFVCLSLLPFLTKEKLKAGTILAVGLLFGYLAVFHLEAYEALIGSLLVLWLYTAIKTHEGAWKRLLSLALIFCVSLLVLSPFLYRQLIWYKYPNHNIGVALDVHVSNPQPTLSFIQTNVVWLFNNLAANILLIIASLALFLVSVLAAVHFRKNETFRGASWLVKLGIAIFLGESIILLLSAINYTSLPFFGNPLFLYFFLYFFIAAANFYLFYLFSSYLSHKILAKTNETKLKSRKLLISAISFMLLIGIYSPFLYQSIVLDVGQIHGSYAVFAVTNEQDLQLMLWIKENLAKNATILVNNYQSGTFIPSLANRKVIYPDIGSADSISYQELETLLEKDSLNSAAMDLMKHFNVTDIYVGSGVSSFDDSEYCWDPNLFLGNPNFVLVKNFGNAYLFQFNYTNPNIVFLDNFEEAHWYDDGWQTYNYGNGISNVTIATNSGCSSGRCLKITAQAVIEPSEWMDGRDVSREIFVQNNSDVNLSFYLNATEGFHDEDTLAVFISNAYRNQSMIIATPNSIFENYTNTISLNSSEGSFGPYNLSAYWSKEFNSSLPSTFILELVDVDFDGIPNVAYVGNIEIFTPLG